MILEEAPGTGAVRAGAGRAAAHAVGPHGRGRSTARRRPRRPPPRAPRRRPGRRRLHPPRGPQAVRAPARRGGRPRPTPPPTRWRRATPKRVLTHHHKGDAPSVVFMFPGGGAQYAGMGRRALRDRARLPRRHRRVLRRGEPRARPRPAGRSCSPTATSTLASKRLERPSVALPALFATEYAMAKWLGVAGHRPRRHDRPQRRRVRGRLPRRRRQHARRPAPRGPARPAVRDASRRRHAERVAAGGRGPRRACPRASASPPSTAPACAWCRGPIALDRRAGAHPRRRRGRHHADPHRRGRPLVDARADPRASSRRFCRTIRFSAPSIPYVSNLTGTWITAVDVTDPTYWVRHLRQAVRFSDGIETILTDPNRVLLEIGPGPHAHQPGPAGATARPSAWPRRCGTRRRRPPTSPSPSAPSAGSGSSGVELDAADLHRDERRRRVPLPTYPFERNRYWVEPDAAGTKAAAADAAQAARRRRLVLHIFMEAIAGHPGDAVDRAGHVDVHHRRRARWRRG